MTSSGPVEMNGSLTAGGEAEVAILSPHLDDAVLSCWHLVDSPLGVTVVNVFAGSPPAGTPTPWWDRLTGASDPVERMHERRAEDRAALALAGRVGVAIDLLDAQYRQEPLPVADLVRRLREVIPAGALVYAPAAMGHHPDHELVRTASLELARAGRRVALYADIPHSIERGWPAWITGEPALVGSAAAAAWSRVLAAAGLDVPRLVPEVRALGERARTRKLRAIDAYRTQRAALDELAFAPLNSRQVLAWEVSWLVPPTALLDTAIPPCGEALMAEVGGGLPSQRQAGAPVPPPSEERGI